MLVTIDKYSIPFDNPITLEKEKRGGFYVSVRHRGRSFIGECSPYPFDQENEERIESQLELGCSILLEIFSRGAVSFRERLFTINQALRNKIDTSVIFAIEMIIFQIHRFFLFDSIEFNLSSKSSIQLNGLLSSNSPEEISKEAKRMIRQGYRSLKLKIRPEESIIPKINSLIDAAGDKVSIRLDANGSFTLDEITGILQKISAQQIEYVEEPTNDPKEFVRFFLETGVLYALDESLPAEPTFLPKHFGHKSLGALILKPMRIGLLNSLLWAELVQSMETKAIFSSNFETNIGLCGILPFIKDIDEPMGFDVIRRFPPKAPLHHYFKNKKGRLFWRFPKKIKKRYFEKFIV